MSSQPSVKILVGYHKPATLLKSDVFVPIHLGRKLATETSKDGQMSSDDYQWLLDNMIGDDTGDNISDLNRYLCEMTGLYWAWKNYDKLGNPDYIGFMHYRRHFNFKALKREFVEKNYWYTSSINQKYLENAGIDDENVKKTLIGVDVICPCPVKRSLSVISEFYKLADALDLNKDYFNQFIARTQQENACLKIALDNYLNSKFEIPCNMFVMKKDLFFDYMKMVFDSILAMHKQINYDRMSINGKRILAYSTEKLLASYLILLKQTQMYNIKYLPISKTKDTDISNIIPMKPAFKDKNITVVYSSDNNYSACTAVSIQSLISNFNPKENLDIIILDDNISNENKKRLLTLKRPNASIRFYNIAPFVEKQNYYTHAHFTRATYFRSYIANILPYHDKVFYFDGDTVILNDVSILYKEIEFKENQNVAATQAINPLYGALKGNFLKVKEMSLMNYWINILKVKNPLTYFNAGIMMLNLTNMRATNFEKKFFDKLNEITDPPGVDQDIFNALEADNVLIFSQKWNFMGYGDWKNFDKWLPENLAVDFYQAQKKTHIIHYASSQKPWNIPTMDNAEYFWYYAKQTPFYEVLLLNMMLNNTPKQKTEKGALTQANLSTPKKTKLKDKSKYWFYRGLGHITCGNLKKKIKQKKMKYKNKIFG